jgi:hypothetical protein
MRACSFATIAGARTTSATHGRNRTTRKLLFEKLTSFEIPLLINDNDKAYESLWRLGESPFVGIETELVHNRQSKWAIVLHLTKPSQFRAACGEPTMGSRNFFETDPREDLRNSPGLVFVCNVCRRSYEADDPSQV